MSALTVEDVMTTKVVAVGEDTSFRDIVGRIEEAGVSAVPVVDEHNRMVGLVSEADLLPKLEFVGEPARPHLFEGRRRRATRTKATASLARDLMTSPAVTVMPNSTIVGAARTLESAGVKQLPVVNLAGRLVGVLTRRDLLKAYLRTDAEIAEDVRLACAELPGAEAAQALVRVDRGVVTLSGTVGRRSAIQELVRHAERVDGVVRVDSRLTYERDDTESMSTLFV